MILLLHGAGASTHSWRALIPMLAERYHIVAMDLPGHAFTQCGSRHRSGLSAMAEDIAALCEAQSWAPSAIVGHSAGAAIALEMARKRPQIKHVVGINAALGRFDGIAGWLFPVLAKVLAASPLTSLAFTASGVSIQRTRRLIEGTGSTLDAEGLALYARLFADRTHVDGMLRMMAQWRVDSLIERLGEVEADCLLIASDRDKAVSSDVSEQATALLPRSRFDRLNGLGHLAHEEEPARICAAILAHLEGPPTG